MVKLYWALFFLALMGMITCILLFTLGFIYAKRVFLGKQYGVILLIICSCISLALSSLFTVKFVACCKDYRYVSNNTYMEEKATVVAFTYSRIHYDGNGRRENSSPKFYLIEKDEYIVLHAKDVEVGQTYLIRFYPNTKICQVVEEVQ